MRFLIISFLLYSAALMLTMYGLYRLALKLGWIPKSEDE